MFFHSIVVFRENSGVITVVITTRFEVCPIKGKVVEVVVWGWGGLVANCHKCYILNKILPKKGKVESDVHHYQDGTDEECCARNQLFELHVNSIKQTGMGFHKLYRNSVYI